MISAVINCYYCHKPCVTTEEHSRTWNHPVTGVVTCCNECGGYEICPQCGELWENLQQSHDTPCFECTRYTGQIGELRHYSRYIGEK